MKSIDFGYSMKIIPQPRKESCIYNLIDKTKQLLKHMRQNALFYDDDNISDRVSSAFLLKLNEDVKNIKSSKRMFISADKTQEDHEKMLYKNVTKTYKKANPSLPKKINTYAKKIAKEFNLDENLDIMAKQQCFVTIKEHKPDFCTNPKYI